MRILLSLIQPTKRSMRQKTRGDAENPRRSLPQPPVVPLKPCEWRCDFFGVRLPLLGQLDWCVRFSGGGNCQGHRSQAGGQLAIFCVEAHIVVGILVGGQFIETWSMFCREAAARSDRRSHWPIRSSPCPEWLQGFPPHSPRPGLARNGGSRGVAAHLPALS